MFLSDTKFCAVIENTPLISLDLIVENQQNQVLLGKRLNRPAQDYWFVPGGRILKDESMQAAFLRLTKDELGQEFKITDATLLGVFDHFYDDNVFNDEFSTHYVALAYKLKIEQELTELPLDIQHQNYRWFEIENLKTNSHIHTHTKWYFD